MYIRICNHICEHYEHYHPHAGERWLALFQPPIMKMTFPLWFVCFSAYFATKGFWGQTCPALLSKSTMWFKLKHFLTNSTSGRANDWLSFAISTSITSFKSSRKAKGQGYIACCITLWNFGEGQSNKIVILKIYCHTESASASAFVHYNRYFLSHVLFICSHTWVITVCACCHIQSPPCVISNAQVCCRSMWKGRL